MNNQANIQIGGTITGELNPKSRMILPEGTLAMTGTERSRAQFLSSMSSQCKQSPLSSRSRMKGPFGMCSEEAASCDRNRRNLELNKH